MNSTTSPPTMDDTSEIKNATNFGFPVRCLEDGRIRLVPFSIPKHAQTVFDHTRDDPHAYAHLSFGPYTAVEEYTKLVQTLEDDASAFAFAILLCNPHEGSSEVKTDTGRVTGDAITGEGEEMVGTMAYYNANSEDRSIEISLVQILPKFRRRGFAVDAARLLRDYALTPVTEGGLGLVRVEWHADTANKGSIAVAQRLGFEEIGVVKYERCLKDGKKRGKVGNRRSEVPPGTASGDVWRDLVMFATYWNTWEGREGGRFSSGRDRE